MRVDTAMWASKAISDYLRHGPPPEEARTTYVARVLASLMLMCRFDLNEEWEKNVQDEDRALIGLLVARSIGRIQTELLQDLAVHQDQVREAIYSKSWDKLSALPDEIWQYISAVSGMTKPEWAEMPEFTKRVLLQQVTCPACGRTEIMKEFGAPKAIDDPLDFQGREIVLVFDCEGCHNKVRYDIQRRDSEQFNVPLIKRSPVYRWIVIGVAVVVGYFVLRIMLR